MDAREFFKSEWLSVDDVPDKATKTEPLRIMPNKIGTAEVYDSREGKKKPRLVMNFTGIEKPYIVSKTCYKMIREKRGYNTEDWMVPMLMWKEMVRGRMMLMVDVEVVA